MFYNLTNTARAMHVIYNSAGKAVVIEAGQTTKEPVTLRDETAIALRRFQDRGAKLHINATDDTGRAVLERAKEPVQKSKPRLYPSPNDLRQAKPPEVIPIRDEIAELEAQKEKELPKVEEVTPQRINRHTHRRS